MNLFQLILEELSTGQKGNNLLLLDLDDTLVKAKNIFIYRKKPDGTEAKLTPEEWAKTPAQEGDDFREFRNADKVARSITTGLPVIPNLKSMDEYIKNGWKIGILTARGMEDVVFSSLKVWLKFKDKTGKLKNIDSKLVKDLVHAISDDTKKYPGKTTFEKKANVIKGLSKKYDRIVFVDDDEKNIKTIKKMIEEEKIKNVYTRLARSE